MRRSSLTFLAVLMMPLALGGCGVPLGVAVASYAADGVSIAASEKTTTDHYVSMVSQRDCALWRFVAGRKICRDREGDHDPYAVDYDEPFRSPSEGGVQYMAPPRVTEATPVTTWEAQAIRPVPKPAPAKPEPAPAEPTTAVAEAAPALEPAPALHPTRASTTKSAPPRKKKPVTKAGTPSRVASRS
ncbi:MAG: hypothetical protein FJX02_03510 [Alphaproteobacteria bacterium]|nr:hypothetical protein [Alphaproteobacteria bacterium]